jgi:glycosyltransferase involved in cell wall biosynthesis
MAPPVVLHVAPITHTEVGGLTFSIPATVRALHHLGVPTGLLTTSPNGPYEAPQPYPIVYYRHLPRRAAMASMPPPLNRPDLVVFHSTYIVSHAVLVHEARRHRIPYVLTPRGGMTREAQQVKRIKKVVGNALFFRWMVRNSAALHCLTEKEALDARDWGRPVFVVGNGIELPPAEALAQPGSGAGLRFVFLGRLDVHHKGLDVLLGACALVQDSLRQAAVQVHLYGPDVAGGWSTVEHLLDAYQIQDLVYLHEPVFGLAKDQVLRCSDLFLHTSRFEGQPMAILEALSYGVPCLVTPGTNMKPEILDHKAGWVSDLNTEAVASTLQTILRSRSELSVRGQAARSLAVQEYSLEQVGTRLLHEYSRLLS